MITFHAILLIVATVPAAALKAVAVADMQSILELESETDAHLSADARIRAELSRMGVEFEHNAQRTELESSATLSPQDRVAAHATKYAAEFDADLDMTKVATEGMSVGVTFDMDTDFQPVSVLKVKKNGVLQEWNDAHPDKAVMVGDEVVRVNDIQWHANSQTFAERIKGQFLAAKHQTPGAKMTLTLHIQRPRRERATRYAAQREDLHRKLYSTEFMAEISMKGVLPRDPLHQAMGWRLNSSVDWQPVSIEKLRSIGLVARYNKEHPNMKILAGDEIIQVNHIQWHHSAAAFEERLSAQFKAQQKFEYEGPPGEKNVFKLYVRRPRSAEKDIPEDQVYTKYYTVNLTLVDAHNLGWHLNVSNDSDPITVDKIMRRKGHPIYNYNLANPTNMVQVGDSILRVNDVTWHSNTKKFAERIEKEFEKARPHATKGQIKDARYYTVNLTLVDSHNLGWHLNVGNDSDPVTVDKIMQKKGHPIYNYNLANPTKMVQVGDSILSVNDVTWHGNTKKFAERIDKEFEKARPHASNKEPQKATLELHLKRPLVQPSTSLAEDGGSSEDMSPHTSTLQLLMQRRLVQPIAKEWSVTLPAVDGESLGWQLSYSDEEFPLTVTKIRNDGAVFEYNQEHPDQRIVAGDNIVMVNDELWREDSSNFKMRVNELYTKSKKIGNITFFVRRPAGVRDTTNDLSADRPFFKEFIVNLPVSQTSPPGWQLQADNDSSPLTIAKIRAAGTVHDWNERNPLNDIQVGDHIAKVNSILWHNNTQTFQDKLNLQMEIARKGKYQAKPTVQLLIQRPWRTSSSSETTDDSDDNDGVIGASEDGEAGADEGEAGAGEEMGSVSKDGEAGADDP
jgi:hypothetical protein